MIRLAVIGDPIEHSLSPAVHGASLDYLGIDYTYEKIHVKPDELKEFANSAKTSLDGFNVTMPHKLDIIQYLAEIDAEGEYYGAVNTVSVKDGKLMGSNTDGLGLSLALNRMNTDFNGKKVTILGAGGAANAVTAAAFKNGAAKITIACRTQSKAEALFESLKTKNGASDTLPKTEVKGFSDTELSDGVTEAEILINTTPLGMEGVKDNFKSFDFLGSLPKGALVSDLIYKPQKTELLKNAEKMGYAVQNGLDMLIFQALAAEELFLEKKLNMQDVYKAVKQKLK